METELSSLEEVQIQRSSVDRLAPLVTDLRVKQLKTLAQEARAVLAGRRVININSTAVGGGVAEMMQVLLAYVKGVDIDIRWLVIRGRADFFALTKRLHNQLHGSAGDGGPLGDAERRVYQDVLEENNQEIAQYVRPGDVVILHDPQTAGLLPDLKKLGVKVIWRGHIGSDFQTDTVNAGWEFLRPYLEDADAYILTRVQFAPGWMDGNRINVIQPSIDPFSLKNFGMEPLDVQNVLAYTGILARDTQSPSPYFTRSDGSQGRITRRPTIYREGPAPSADSPAVVQVSRWDRLKDMQGVMEGFAEYVVPFQDAHLMLVGPDVNGVTDDPEGSAVLMECVDRWRQFPATVRSRIQLVALPMEDREENAIMVNAIQNHATVVVQKSLAEGFGLTVTEAMWKARPVLASRVGGVQEQIIDGEHGILLRDPRDLQQMGYQLIQLLRDEEYRQHLGENARARVLGSFLADRHLEQYAKLVISLSL